MIQADCVVEPRQRNIVHCAAFQQQPPYDYQMSGLGLQIFGVNHLGVRSSALIYGVLSPVVFFFLLRLLFATPVAAVTALLLALNLLLIQNSQEGRPFSLGFYMACCLLLAVFERLKGFNFSPPQPSPWHTRENSS